MSPAPSGYRPPLTPREYALMVIAGCDGLDALDRASNLAAFFKGCPRSFTPRQRAASHRLVLAAYLRAIGRC